MAKFDLKKAILENKATFFGSLNEGQFSWITQDTGQQIGSEDENRIPVYMFDNKGNYYYENRYDGYGDFGGKDYYELLAQMNGYAKGDRMDGIDMAFGKMKTPNGGPVLFPALVTKPNEFNFKTHDFTKEAESDPNQSWYAPEEEEDFIDQNDEEVFGDNEDEEDDMMEGKKEYYKDAEADDAEHIKALEKDMKDDKTSGKMKMSEFKAKIKEMILKEMEDEKVDDINDETPESEEDFLAELEGMLDEAKGDEEVTDDVTTDASTDAAPADDTETIDTTTTTEVNPDVKAVQDALTQAQAAAQQLGDQKLTDQIGNTITFFTRAHVVEKGAVAEVEEKVNEALGLVSLITILIASLLLNPISGPLLMGLFKYLFQDLPEQRAKAKELKTYNGPDKKEQVLALAKEIESQLSPGKKKYLTSLVNAIGKSKLEDEAKAYQELDSYAKREKNLMARELNENINVDLENALEDLPIPMDMEEETLNESMFPMLKKILK